MKFRPRESSTFITNGQSYTLSYGSGTLTVLLGYDTLRVSVPAMPSSSWPLDQLLPLSVTQLGFRLVLIQLLLISQLPADVSTRAWPLGLSEHPSSHPTTAWVP